MSVLTHALWGFLAILGAVVLAFVTGLVHPEEKVNGLWLVVAASCIYVLAFRFYGRWLAKESGLSAISDDRSMGCKKIGVGSVAIWHAK